MDILIQLIIWLFKGLFGDQEPPAELGPPGQGRRTFDTEEAPREKTLAELLAEARADLQGTDERGTVTPMPRRAPTASPTNQGAEGQPSARRVTVPPVPSRDKGLAELVEEARAEAQRSSGLPQPQRPIPRMAPAEPPEPRRAMGELVAPVRLPRMAQLRPMTTQATTAPTGRPGARRLTEAAQTRVAQTGAQAKAGTPSAPKSAPAPAAVGKQRHLSPWLAALTGADEAQRKDVLAQCIVAGIVIGPPKCRQAMPGLKAGA